MTKVVLYSKDNCPACVRAKNALESLGYSVEVLKFGVDYSIEDLRALIPDVRSVPQAFLEGKHIPDITRLPFLPSAACADPQANN